jgi:hypothetical protein
MLRRILLTSVVSLLLLAGPAAAGSIVVTLTFSPGKLLVKSAPESATATGAVQVPVTIADGRGNGRGWTLKLVSGRPVQVLSVAVHCAANSTCTLPRASRGPSGAVVLRARPDSGMGVMNLVVTIAPLPAGSPATQLAFTAS